MPEVKGVGARFVEIPFEVLGPLAGARLDVFLAARLHRYSRARVQALIDEGRVFLGGRAAKASRRMAEGERVIIRYPVREDPPPRVERLEVLFEDSLLLAVNKPGGVLSHPTDKTVRNSVTVILARQFPGQKLHLAHRLDRETSGVLLFAKTPAAARSLNALFIERRIEKRYWAIVSGRVAFSRRVVDLPLGYDNHEVRVRQRIFPPGEGVPALTHVRRLALGEEATLVCAWPKTGRLHQIRVHLASLGHPILGDKIYAGDGQAYLKAWRGEAQASGRQMLHAESLRLEHPATGKTLRLEAPLPDDFRECLARFGLDVGAGYSSPR